MATCPDCGSDVDADRTTCPVCAADMTAAPSDAEMDPTPPQEPATPTRDVEPEATPPPPPPASRVPVPVPAPRSVVHASGLSSELRTWALLTHLSSLVFGFLGPLVMWLVKRDEHPFLDHHGREAVNFHLSQLLYGLIGGVLAIILTVVTLGLALFVVIPIAIGWSIAVLVFTIIAAVKANNGEGYRYPLTIRFIAE